MMKRITVGILAHVDSGKTTLSEAMLYLSGEINRLGRVDHRDSFLDTFSLERDRGITIFSKQAMLSYKDTQFTLLDTPGHVDFSAETERTLQVLDYAILVISATDGVQSHTQTLWRLLRKYRVPVFIFVNKTDLEGADKELAMNSIKTKLSEHCVDMKSAEANESIALCSDELLESFYENGSLEESDIIRAVKERKVFPCYFGSALKLDGVEEFLNELARLTVMPEYSDTFGAKVFKISQDNQKNRLTFMKLTGGRLRVREVLKSNKNTNSEKVNQIRIYSGEKFTAVDSAEAGTVCAVTGISFADSGDGLGCEKDSAMPVLEPVLTYTVIINDKTDAHAVLEKLKALEKEDPQLRLMWNSTLSEIQIQLMGEIQLEVLSSLVKDRFDIDISFDTGNIIYKETITDKVEGVGHFEPLRHYAEVHLLLEPAERNSGLTFKTDCKEDELDKNWQRLILTHLYEKTHTGVLTGSPITDMVITLKSGRAHAKHTEGGDFRQATYRAVRQGLRKAESVLLEPYYDFVLEVPSDNTGRAMTDIQRMSGSFEQPELEGEYSVIKGRAPVFEMRDYTKEILKYSKGKGRLSLSFSGYDICHNAEEIINLAGYDCDSDKENTADSVFCSHGAGHTVKWNEVESHMHLPSCLEVRSEKPVLKDRKTYFSNAKKQKDIFALDKELMQIFEQTYGPVKHRDFNNTKSPSVTANTKKENYKRVKTPVYDGKDYLLVDGYNVIFSWDKLRELSENNIDGARNMLINILCNYQGYKKCEVILVFDAYKVKGNDREVEKIDNISVVYTKEAETADMYIEKTSHELSKNNRVRVVTSDALEQIIILGGGALRVSSREFQSEVEEAEKEIRALIENHL